MQELFLGNVNEYLLIREMLFGMNAELALETRKGDPTPA